MGRSAQQAREGMGGGIVGTVCLFAARARRRIAGGLWHGNQQLGHAVIREVTGRACTGGVVERGARLRRARPQSYMSIRLRLTRPMTAGSPSGKMGWCEGLVETGSKRGGLERNRL